MAFSNGRNPAISTAQTVQVGREYDSVGYTYPAAAGFTPGIEGTQNITTAFAGSYTGKTTVASAGDISYGSGALTVYPQTSDATNFTDLQVGDTITATEGGTAVSGSITAISVSSSIYTITATMTGLSISANDTITLGSTRPRTVRATRKFSAQDFMFREQLAQEMFDNERGYGIISRSNRAPIPTRNHTVLEQNSRVDFEQILLPMLAGVEGGVTPSLTWDNITQTYTMVASATAVDAPGEIYVTAVSSNATTVTIYPRAEDVRAFELIFGGGMEADQRPTGGQIRAANNASADTNYITFDVPSTVPTPTNGVYSISGTNADLTGTTLASGDTVALQGAQYEWQFAPVATSRPQLETYTFEYAESDLGSGTVFSRAMHYGYCMSVEMTMGVEGVPSIRANYDGRIAGDIPNVTQGLSASDFPSAGALRTSVYFDDSWANLGNTQVLGQIYSTSFNYTSHFFHQYYTDGREDMDFSNVLVRPRQVAMSYDVLVDTASNSLVRSERERKRSDQLSDKRRYARIQWEGARVNGITQRLQLDCVGVHADDSLSEYGGDRDGNNVTRISLMSIFDDASQRDMRITLRNGLSTFV